jgi:hypothetical protein
VDEGYGDPVIAGMRNRCPVLGKISLARNPKSWYTIDKENFMPQAQIMTLDEKLDLGMKVIALQTQGQFEEAERLNKTMPVPPYMAKFIKDRVGLDALLNMGLNLSEAEVEYGPEYLSR